MSSPADSETDRRLRFGWAALCTLLLGWGLAGLMLFLGLRKADQIDKANFDRSVHTIRELLETHIEKVEGALGRMQTFATFNNHASQGEWMEMLGSIDPQTNFKYIRELGAARYHPSWSLNAPTNGPWDRMGFVIFRAVGPDFDAGPTGDLFVATASEDWEVIADGIKAAQPRMPTPSRMPNEITHQVAVVATMFVVFYNPGQTHFATVADGHRKTNETARVNFNQGQREGQFAGVIFGIFDLSMLIRSAFGEKRLPVEFELHCGPAKDATTRVDGRPFAADGRSRLDSWSTQSWYTRPYHYRCYTTPEFEAQSPRRLVWLLSGSMAVVTLALAAFVHVQAVARGRAESIADLREQARAMVEAAGHERESLSRDLHDGTVQAMYASILTLKRAMNDLESDPDAAREKVASSIAILDGAISELRGLLINLSPTPLAGEVLVNSLKTLVHTMTRANGTVVVLEGDLSPLEGLKSQSGVELLNLLREAISNAVRHSGARMVRIVLRSEGGQLWIDVQDDGCGFDPAKTTHEGHGLANMKSRSGNMGATFDIESSPGNGTTIRLTLRTG